MTLSVPSATAPGALRAFVDVGRLDHNIGRFHAAAASAGVAVRAHVKGHRSPHIAARQTAAGAAGIAVHYVAEARRHLAAGMTDIVVAHPWHEPWRLALLAELAEDCELGVHVDTAEMAADLAAAVASRAHPGTRIGVRVRCEPDQAHADLEAIVKAVSTAPGLRFDGLTHYQSSDGVRSAGESRERGAAAARRLVGAAVRLHESGFDGPTVSLGGTPTAAGALGVEGVTEVCAGAYALMDAGMAALGICAPDDVAVSVAVHAGPGTPAYEAASHAVALHPYTWQTPADLRIPGADRFAPPHICPLAQEPAGYTVAGSDADGQDWPTWFVRDTDPAATGDGTERRA